MISDKTVFTLKEITEQEESTVLQKFNSEVAWKLGNIARDLLAKFDSFAVINISLPTGQVLFHTVVNSGSSLDNDSWVARKQKTVIRFNKSSFYIGTKLNQTARTLEGSSFISEKDYATHGGAVPIKIESFDSIVGILTISGLKQHEDHLLAIEALQLLKSSQ